MTRNFGQVPTHCQLSWILRLRFAPRRMARSFYNLEFLLPPWGKILEYLAPFKQDPDSYHHTDVIPSTQPQEFQCLYRTYT